MSAPRHLITILDTKEQYWCKEDEHLLQGMLSLGKKGIPSGCHGGGCGVCKVEIYTGKEGYRNLPMSRAHISEKDESNNIVLACRTLPVGDIELSVLGGIKKNIVRSTSNYTFNYGSRLEQIDS